MTVLYDRRWYRTLKSGKYGLFGSIGRENCQNRFLVCWMKNQTRYYSLFANYIEFVKYVQVIPLDKRCFFEILLGEFGQKPHFDIDIEANVQTVKLSDIFSKFGSSHSNRFRTIQY